MIWRSCSSTLFVKGGSMPVGWSGNSPVRFLHISNISKSKTHRVWDERPDSNTYMFISDFTWFRSALNYNAGRLWMRVIAIYTHFVTDTIKISTKVGLFLISQGLKPFFCSKKVARKTYWAIRNSTPPERALVKDKVPLGKKVCPSYWNEPAFHWENSSQLLNLCSIHQAMAPALNNTHDYTAPAIV